MKIGLLTFHMANNYGALLQTYATQHVLKEMGHVCEIINLRRRPKNKVISYIYNNILNRGFEVFRKKYLNPCTEKFYDGDDLSSLNSRYDCFLVGSDQVWRSRFTGDLALNYFLDFVDDDKRKISYSSSFGISSWSETPELTPIVKNLLRRFDAVSVRENSGVEICQEVFGVAAKLVLDPSLLLTGENYGLLAGEPDVDLPERYAATFLLDGNASSLEKNIERIVREIDSLSTINLSIPKLNFGRFSFDWNPHRVSEWIHVLKNAEYIITESFHCVAFAIIFKRKFICIVNHRRGKARLESFLGMLGLSDYLIERDECNKVRIAELIGREIDFQRINSILKDKKEESLEFLRNSIG